VSLDFSYNRTKGYLNDPYRLIQKSTQIVPGVFLPLTYPENRPDQRSNWTVFAGLNHAVPAAAGAVEANYRLYHDTFGTTAHTLELKWLQKIGQQLVLTPLVRYYQQTAANFYRVSLDGTSIVPGFLPKPTGPFYSADYRLAKLRTWGYGMEAVWNTPLNWLRVDVAWEQYDMQGRDGFTPSSFYPRANITTFGVKISW
jgi:hypothetical protein